MTNQFYTDLAQRLIRGTPDLHLYQYLQLLTTFKEIDSTFDVDAFNALMFKENHKRVRDQLPDNVLMFNELERVVFDT
jgi:hypothetical protein|tara:strand:- start:2908 stop:3141 length:234 start_codon:yes stop_codon:yes gene_type:complete